MRNVLFMIALFCPVLAMAQVPSSYNGSCVVSRDGAISCEGLGNKPDEAGGDGHFKLWNILVTLAPGAAWERPNVIVESIILGIEGGNLINEMAPFRDVPLERNSVTLIQSGKPFRLRNDSSMAVTFRVIEIRPD